MVRPMKPTEKDKVLEWHFRNVDKLPGGRDEYARKFPAEYQRTIDTLNGKEGFVLIADDGELSGYIGIRIDRHSFPYRAYLSGFYVEPQKRQKGYGRELAESAIKEAAEKGAKSLSVEVGLSKPWLIKFYESVGFVPASMNMYQKLK